jgi:dihydroflavonol-4-reductase
VTTTLVTGGTGSLGSALTRSMIDDGADVAVLVPPGEGLGGLTGYQGRFAVRRGDVRDHAALRRAMTGIGQVFHLAGVAAPLNRLHGLMCEVNIAGARNVARAAAEAGVSRFVHTSSVAAVGYPPPAEVADERFDFARSVVRNSYMLTKHAGERAVLEVGRHTGMPVVVLNPGPVIAPHSHLRYGWAALLHQARRHRLTVYPPGGVSVCTARYLVAGQLAAMRHGQPGERYILCTADLSYRELFGHACRVAGVPPPRWAAPAGAMRLAGWLGWAWSLLVRDPARSPLLVPENAELAVRCFRYDGGKARRDLGLCPGDVTESIAEVNEWLTKGDVHAVAGPARA